MLRRSTALSLRASAPLLAWTAEDGASNAPDTTFRNVKPSAFLRWWRQLRQRAWMIFVWDEEWQSHNQEGFMHTTRMEQIIHTPMSSYGSVPGSYSDPVLYQTKSTSPYRWSVSKERRGIQGHWYMHYDELLRLKHWQPKNPDDPFEMFPRPPNYNLTWDEEIDEHGNRNFTHKYTYHFHDPHGNAYPSYPTNHLYRGVPHERDRVEPYGFKQGELLRCDEEEEEVLRRVAEEEDREWELVKSTELIQEPWMYPGKIRPRDLVGSIDRAKERWRKQVKEGRPTDPRKDPDYDFVQAGEFVEPRDGPRAEWRDMWTSNRPDGKPKYRTTGNDGDTLEDHEKHTGGISPSLNNDRLPVDGKDVGSQQITDDKKKKEE